MASDLVIVCKTYRQDLRRAQRLLDSISSHNVERLPVVLVVPAEDLPLFRGSLLDRACELVPDEDVVFAHPEAKARDLLARYRSMPGYLSQQVVKAEAWRLLGCSSYLCADADAVFLRDFTLRDFLTPDGHPYSQLHQSKDYHLLALNRGHDEVIHHFKRDSAQMKQRFGREGPDYDFGPLPLVWSSAVWNDLATRYLAPRDMTLWDAIEQVPIETRWYGEALLAYRSIPIEPIEPLFRVYHYDWQMALMQRLGESEAKAAEQHLGIVYQSNWEFELDLQGARSFGSRLARRFQRWRRTRRA